MEKEKIARGISPLLGLGKRTVNYSELSRQYRAGPRTSAPRPGKEEQRQWESDKKRKALSMLQRQRALQSDFGRNLPVDQEIIADQLSKEMSFGAKLDEVARVGGTATGVMPIRVQVPTFGQVYRFAKQIVSDEPLTVEATYVKGTPFTIIKLMILLVIIYALYLRRNWLKRIWDSESRWYKKNVAKSITPLSMVVIFGFLFLFSLFFLHLYFAKILLFIFLVTVIYYVAHRLKARKERKREDKATELQE